MKLTARLKKWAVENLAVKSTASDDKFRKAVGEALTSGDLEKEKYQELTKDKKDEESNEFLKTLKAIQEELNAEKGSRNNGSSGSESEKEMACPVCEKEMADTEDKKEVECKDCGIKKKKGNVKPENPCPSCEKEMSKSEDETKLECADCGLTKTISTNGTKTTPASTKGNHRKPSSRMEKMIASVGGFAPGEEETPGEGKSIEAKVKEAIEDYDTTTKALHFPDRSAKSGGIHPLANKRVTDFGRGLDAPSHKNMALAGAWAKFQLAAVTPKIAGSAQRAWEMMSDHDKSLLLHLTEEEQWDASKNHKLSTQKGYKGGIKALIDDSTSGGLEAAPIVFDDMAIQTPLLNGELFPLVNTVPLDRGRRVEGVSTGTVTGSWGGVDDTAINLFNTSSYVSAFDTTIFRWEGAVKIGLDFMSDTPIDFGQHITQQYGERLLEDLDNVVAQGNGTTQPEGIMNKSGATSVSFGGSTTLGNYESLRFGVAKPEHTAGLANTIVFCGTETSYQRARAIPVGSSDARRLGGMNYDSYTWMERPYKINESLTNQQIFYAVLGRYRMYRRRGFEVRTSTEGDTLIRNNELLISITARYGGQQERGATIARTTDAPS